MDKETEKWYEDQFSLFASQGWKDFVTKVEEMHSDYNKVGAIKTSEQLFMRQGMLDILRWVIIWPEMVEENYKLLTERPHALGLESE